MTLSHQGGIMFSFLADILTQIYKIWPSYAGSIIVFTLIFMIIMTPVTLRQTKSMLAMQRLAPETKKLRKKYGDDREDREAVWVEVGTGIEREDERGGGV